MSPLGRKKLAAPSGPRLRVAHVWRDEVMADAVMTEPGPVTLGTDNRSTFTIPDVGLPEAFAILRPGARGYVLTLGTGMAGRVKLGDDELEVARFVAGSGGDRAEGAAGAFRATPVGPGDWGVIELDDRGDHTLFFQFVAEEAPLAKSHWGDLDILLPALAFAIVLHSAFLVMSFVLEDGRNGLVFPGSRSLLVDKLVNYPAEPEPEDPGANAAVEGDKKEKNVDPAPTRGAEGKRGGEGEKRSAGPKPEKPDIAEDIEVGQLTEDARETIGRVVGGGDSDMPDPLARVNQRLAAMPEMGDRGRGRGSGSGLGPGTGGTGGATRGGGSGGGGSNDRDVIGEGKDLDTGGNRKGPGGPGSGTGGSAMKERGVAKLGQASGKLDGLTKEEIAEVMRKAAGRFRACYQDELNRNPKLGGTLVVNFRIEADGKVSKARVVGPKSSLRSGAVESCIVRRVKGLRFPAKGGGVVNFPFDFYASGG